jgi:uncharacterized protein YecT (DUF1311 family)
MFIPYRLAALAVATAILVPASASAAIDEFLRASSSGPTELALCKADGELATSGECKKTNFTALTKRIEKSLQAALAKTPANIRPLLKRDQAWFNEMMLSAVETVPEVDDEQKEAFVEKLRRRAATLETIALGFGRPGVAGRWINTFGSVTVTPSGGGYRIAIDTSAAYGAGSDRRRECKATAELKPASGAWLTGIVLPDEDAPPAKTNSDGKSEAKPVTIKMRRQGETLRLVVGNAEYLDEERPNCNYMWQITASYFADGKPDAAAATDKADLNFVAPTLDCTRPETASDEEICADPDLADNDQRLNRAWKALLPRLDDATRRALAEDQRNWVRAQTNQYPQFLHPAWEKQSSFMHFTVDGRDKLDRLQRERIALLEGFDDKRSGFAGIWLSHTAVLKVTIADDGNLKAEGWKWEQGDWKAGCDFDIKGKVANGAFRSEEKRKNPDTLERDHATLVVNRLDDVFAKKRDGSDADEPKCRRNVANSSTVRLFPAPPRPISTISAARSGKRGSKSAFAIVEYCNYCVFNPLGIFGTAFSGPSYCARGEFHGRERRTAKPPDGTPHAPGAAQASCARRRRYSRRALAGNPCRNGAAAHQAKRPSGLPALRLFRLRLRHQHGRNHRRRHRDGNVCCRHDGLLRQEWRRDVRQEQPLFQPEVVLPVEVRQLAACPTAQGCLRGEDDAWLP